MISLWLQLLPSTALAAAMFFLTGVTKMAHQY